MDYLATLEQLHPDIIDSFLVSGKSDAIPLELQQFIKQITWAAEIKEYEGNINRAAKKLRQRVLAQQKVMLNIHTAKARIYSAMAYFDIDDNVPQKIWDRDTANKMEDLAKLCIANDKYNEAYRCFEKANFYRQRANTNDRESGNISINFLISTEYKLEDSGFERKNLKQIAAKAQKGFYINLINGLPASEEEKKKLFSDADIEDADFEEIDNYAE
nr:hypothetical protein [uncultured Carboxylicivirga sp.]